MLEHIDNNLIILCDFDGTISVRDVTDILLQRFGQPGCDELEAAWEAGEIGSQQCMSQQIALLAASRVELDACLETIDIDPNFARFAQIAQENGIALHIVSDGLDYAIHAILQRHGLDVIPVFANHLAQTGERSWRLDFPYANPDCGKRSGHCKCRHVMRCRQQFRRTLYIGDGASDYCVSGCVDQILAKESLIHYCEQRQIPHYPITDFEYALRLLPTLLPYETSVLAEESASIVL